MISLEILDVKSCMSHLLLKDTFHAFYFIEGDIATFNTFHIDGQLHKDFLILPKQPNACRIGSFLIGKRFRNSAIP